MYDRPATLSLSLATPLELGGVFVLGTNQEVPQIVLITQENRHDRRNLG
jgi:hypothetical protein